MKTPKRTYTTNFLEWGYEFCHRLSSGQQRAYARWKRKNRTAQLKHTIARLTQENAKLKTILRTNISAIVNDELIEAARAAKAFAQQHMSIYRMQDPPIEVIHDKNGKPFVCALRNPVSIKWDDVHIGPVADWFKKIKN